MRTRERLSCRVARVVLAVTVVVAVAPFLWWAEVMGHRERS